MKSSRRKQTNPNRVSAGNRELDPAGTPRPDKCNSPDNQEDEAREPRSESEESSSPKPQMTSSQYSDFEQPLNMHVSASSCQQCPETFGNMREFQDHKAEVHGPEMKKPRVEVSLEDFPTAYHRLGRELQESTEVPLPNGHLETENSVGNPAADITSSAQDTPQSSSPKPSPLEKTIEESSYIEPSHPQPPCTLKPIKEPGSEPSNGKSDRIFHMDAYCDLCDREFCNKYFLKTHKANKHGIYEDNSPPATSVANPFPNLMIPQDPLASFNFKMDSMKPHSSEPLLPWSFKLDSPSQPPKKTENSPSVKNMDPPLPMFSLPMQSSEPPKSCNTPSNISSSNGGSSIHSGPSSNSSSSSSNATSMLTAITNNIKSASSSSNSAPPSHDPSMEDYCHICQKHFCNKYYLKKHKQDVHGIAPENTPTNANKRSRSSLLDLPLGSTNPMMLPQPLAGLTGMHGLPGMPGLPSMPGMPPGVMVINPYSLPPVAIIPAGSLMPGQQIPPPPHHIISQPMSMAPLSESVLLSHAPPTPASSTSANSAETSPNKPSPSIHDDGAHCNICSKEFCNEFYLQIHKESKHGIKRCSDDGSRGERAIALVKESKFEKSSPPPLAIISKSEPGVFTTNSLLDQSLLAEGGFLYCNLCNKEFTSKYMYRIHRIHDHGLSELTDPMLAETGELQQKEDAMRCMNETLMRMTADASAVGYASSYGNTLSVKPQENVRCDICNKQITNQYFLRLHKFNVHGIDPSCGEKYDSNPPSSPVIPVSKPKTPPSSGSLSISSTSQPLNLTPHIGKPAILPFLPPKIDFRDMPPFVDFGRDFKSFRDVPSFLADTINHELFARSQNHNRHLDLNFFGLPPLGKLPNDDSAKLNFDPEAYCEICKKEFCSKYFLRTHKQNIHGIKYDTSSNPTTKSSESDRAIPTSPIRPYLTSNNSKPADSQDKSSWRWKEPINSSRVICEICNKEVCNKYFLRTHKQKKHGIQPTSQSPNISMHGSPVASDCDTASNASSQPDDKPFRMDAFNLPQMIPLPPSERISEKFQMKPLGLNKVRESVHLNNNTDQSETCNICNQRFKNLNWLKDHIVKDHSDTEALDMRSKSSGPIYTCQVCGIDFPAELSVQLHLIQEHNARVTLDTDEPQIPTEEASLPNGEGNSSKVAELSGRWTLRKKASNHRRLKKYVCSRCGFDSHWLSSLLDHERKEHGIVLGTAPVYSCKSCQHLFPTAKFLSAHMVFVHGFSSDDAFHEVKRAEPTIPNSFRCAHCPAVFPTRSWGMAHVRHVHIRSRHDLAIKNSFEKSLLRCPSCSFKTHFASRLQRHVKCRHRSSLRFSQSIYGSSSVIRSSPGLGKLQDNVSPSHAPREDSIIGTNSMYTSIAASLLSESGRAESPTLDRKDLLLQSFKLPLGPSAVVESAPFKMTAQAPPASAVVGL